MLRVKRKKFTKKLDKKYFPVNQRIRASQVSVIDENGESLGNMPLNQALQLAEEKELDLVEVNPKSEPPICKILNYGQFQYQQSRKAQQQKSHAKKVETKGIRISYKIGKHDLEFRQNQAQKFLSKGDKVKIEMILRGRERQYTKEAIQKINVFINYFQDNVIIEQVPKKQGNQLSAIIAPSKNPVYAKAKNQADLPDDPETDKTDETTTTN